MRVSKKQIFLLPAPMILGVLLFVSWYRCQEYYEYKNLPTVRYAQQDCFWKTLDYAAFRMFNAGLQRSEAAQVFWAVTNLRIFDLVAALWMAGLFWLYYVRNPRAEDRVMIMRFGLFIVCVIVLFIVFTISPLEIKVRRCSPTMTPPLSLEAVRLSQSGVVPWRVKESSSVCFPGDHALVLLVVGSCLLYGLRSLPYRIAVVFGIVFFSLPRLAGGGHWLSDVLVGSTANFAVFFPVVMFAPIRERMLGWLHTPALYCHRMFERGCEMIRGRLCA